MDTEERHSYTAFVENRQLGKGSLVEIAAKVKRIRDRNKSAIILIFDDKTCETIDLDLHGSLDDVRRRLQPPAHAESEKQVGPGRPKLGVTSREVSLLPRHWEWLSYQSGGASVTIRKLVEEAKKKNQGVDKVRQAQEATYRFMSIIAGNLPGFEEALRALYGKNPKRFKQQISLWPKDIREHAEKLAKPAFIKLDKEI